MQAVSVKHRLQTADCGLQTADCGPVVKCRQGVKCRLGVKCRKNHIRGKIREMLSRKQCGSLFFFFPELRDFVTHGYPCPAEWGTRLMRPDKKHM